MIGSPATTPREGLWSGLSREQEAELNALLDPQYVSTRKQGGTTLSYVQGHHAIREANRIFGHAGWQTMTDCKLVVERDWKSKEGRDGWLVCYSAHTTVRVQCVDGTWVEKDGWGYGEGIDYSNPGQAHESAVKEAETDALKRALVKFGDPFGLALYDKQQEHVADANGNGNGRKQAPPPAQARQQVPPAPPVAGSPSPLAQDVPMPTNVVSILLGYYGQLGLEKGALTKWRQSREWGETPMMSQLPMIVNWISTHDASVAANLYAALRDAGVTFVGGSVSETVTGPQEVM